MEHENGPGCITPGTESLSGQTPTSVLEKTVFRQPDREPPPPWLSHLADHWVRVADAGREQVRGDVPAEWLDPFDLECRILQDRAKSEGNSPGRQTTFTRADTIRQHPLRWLWYHRMPLGEITLLAGRAGLGKSTLSALLVASVTTGRMAPGVYAGEPRDVLVLATEDAWEHTIAPRLTAAGADMTRVFRPDVQALDGSTVPFSAALDADRLVAECRSEGLDVALIIVDPLVSVLTGKKRNDGDDVRPILEKLKRVAEQLGANILGLVHFNKGGNSQSALERVTGSGEFGNVVRSAMAVAEDKSAEDEGVMILDNIKHNLAPSGLPALTYRIVGVTVETPDGPCETSRVEFTGESTSKVEDLMRDESDTGSATGEAVAWLREYLTAQGITPSAEVRKAAAAEQISLAALKRAADRLGVKRPRARTAGATTTWELPAPVGSRVS